MCKWTENQFHANRSDARPARNFAFNFTLVKYQAVNSLAGLDRSVLTFTAQNVRVGHHAVLSIQKEYLTADARRERLNRIGGDSAQRMGTVVTIHAELAVDPLGGFM